MNLSREELEMQHETGLLSMLSNTSMPLEIRLYAAVLLYKRGSRFVAYQEFVPYKEQVLDYILEEYASSHLKPFAPNILQDLAGRLHSGVKNTACSLSKSSQTLHEKIDFHRGEYLKSFADHNQEFANQLQNIEECKANVSEIEVYLRNRINNSDNKIHTVNAKTDQIKKLVWIVCSSATVASLLGSYLITHFLR
jgi:translation initiation factor 2B subunit (eIF-2B alpha/beta/delta family)